MKLKSILVTITISIFIACGSKKAAVSKDALIKEADAYVTKVDGMNLKEEVTEGALTDVEGFKDIGTFKYTVYYDDKTNELFKIENIETTDETIKEAYYFKDHDFLFVKFSKPMDGQSELYAGSLKGGTAENLKFYRNKAERFQKEFQKNH